MRRKLVFNYVEDGAYGSLLCHYGGETKAKGLEVQISSTSGDPNDRFRLPRQSIPTS